MKERKKDPLKEVAERGPYQPGEVSSLFFFSSPLSFLLDLPLNAAARERES